MQKFCICVESSHQKGIGHLIRAINLIELLKTKGEDYVLIVNNDPASLSFLKKRGINFEIAITNDLSEDWETAIIKKHKINVWINDRLDTSITHASHVKRNGVLLVSIDDKGDGSELADINFGSLPFSFSCDLKGKRVFKGLKYLILDKAVDTYKKIRNKTNRILVVLGGSDTYNVTVKVVGILRGMSKAVTIVTGPLFRHSNELGRAIDGSFVVKKTVSSLIREFADYDIAITGGGVTPFEANASGLPCIIIANELFEIPNGQFLSDLGSSVFAGYHENIMNAVFNLDLDINRMSALGMDKIKTDGAENIYKEIYDLI